MDWPLTLRPLPRPVAPVRDETITSYLTRLAEANRLDPAGLRHLLTGSNRKDADVPFASLAAITGRPPTLLAYAMPQLCTPHERAHVGVEHRPRPRPRGQHVACRACTGSAATGRAVTVWALHEQVVCRRHRRWLGQCDMQLDLSGLPEILDAARRHRWLIRRHGRDTVMRAYRDAHYICIGWNLNDHHRHRDPGTERRMRTLHGPDWRDIDDAWNDALDAAHYPQAVALTRLLASPYWRWQLLENGWPWHDEFVDELRRTVAPDYVWNLNPRRGRGERECKYDPLIEWKMETRLLQREPLPADSPWNLPETLESPGSDDHPRDQAADRVGSETWDGSSRQPVPQT